MATELKLRRGTTSQHSSFTGAEAEVTVDTDKETVVVHDGSTAGGYALAREDMSNVTDPSFDSINVDSGTLYVDSANNRVGIGTSSPAEKLDIDGNLSVTQIFARDLLKFDRDGIIGGLDFANSNGVLVIDADATNIANFTSIRFRLDGSEAMRIDSNGNVGIGTTSTSEKLEVSGNTTISGSLSKGSGSFKIDHPLKPESHHLVHSFVESPQADNIYRGKVDLVKGTATVNIDSVAGMTEGTFAALNREVQCFTSNESGWTAVRGSVVGNILTIKAHDDTCTDTISWMVVGERQDQHMYDTEWTDENGKVIVELLKESKNTEESN